MLILQYCVFFFFSSRRRHTRYWRDWSSDVCSSDLAADRGGRRRGARDRRRHVPPGPRAPPDRRGRLDGDPARLGRRGGGGGDAPPDRESGGEGKRGDFGGRRIIKKKKIAKTSLAML